MPTVDVTMPETGSEAGPTVIAWLKEPGQAVEADEPICLVSWNGTTAEVGSPATGVLRMLAVAAGMTVVAGTSLALIDTRLAPMPEPEPEPVAVEPDPEPEPAVVEPEPEPEPEAAEPAPEPEPAAAEPEPEPEAPDRVQDSTAISGRMLHSTDLSEPEPVEVTDEPDPVPERLLRDAPWDEPEEVDLTAFRSPAVRRLVAELGIDLDAVPGTGAGGRVTLRDVRAHAQTAQTSA